MERNNAGNTRRKTSVLAVVSRKQARSRRALQTGEAYQNLYKERVDEAVIQKLRDTERDRDSLTKGELLHIRRTVASELLQLETQEVRNRVKERVAESRAEKEKAVEEAKALENVNPATGARSAVEYQR